MRWWTCGVVTVLLAGLAVPATAQRRPIGAEGAPAEALPEGDADDGKDAAAQADDEARRKAEAAKKAEAEKQAILDEEKKREEAEAAAAKAADEAARKKQEAEAATKAAADAKKQADADARQRAELNAARAEWVLVRSSGTARLRLTLKPGAPEVKAVQEVRLDVSEKLAVPDPRYGEYKPLRDAQLTATVRFVEPLAEQKPAPKKQRAPEPVPEPMVYRVHPLDDAGVYGFHLTLLAPGRYEVKLAGAGDAAIEATFELYPGVWPPPDWDEERARAAASSSRRSPITF